MIQITCSGCRSRLNAKEDLVGQTRKCPKCGTAVLIERPPDDATHGSVPAEGLTGPGGESPTVHVEPPQEPERLAEVAAVAAPPKELKTPNRYVICDRQRIAAVWEGDGTGWQLKTPQGLISAKRNFEQIPGQGLFRLIELRVAHGENALHLTGIVCHELAARYALLAIGRGDHQILDKIVGPSGLTRDQKQLVRRYLQEAFMPEVWRHRDEIVDFLSNNDFHSQGVV